MVEAQNREHGTGSSGYWPPTAEWALVYVTIALMVYTARLWGATKRLAADTNAAAEKQAKLTRRALRLSRQEFIASFRPRLSVRQVARLLHDGESAVEFMVTNGGGSAARIVDARVAVVLRAKGKALPTRPFADTKPFIEDRNISAGESITVTWSEKDEGAFPLSMKDGFRKEANLFILGTIAYMDKVGVRRNLGFCRIFDDDTERFRTLDDPDYEYAD